MGTILLIPAAWASAGIILGFVIAGIFFVFGVFDNAKKTRTKDGEAALTFVNDALEKKVKLLEDQLQQQSEKIADQEKRIDAIEKENKTLKEVLQGRDDETQAFQKLGFETMQNSIPEILTVSRTTAQSVDKLCQSIDGLVKALQK